MPNKLPKVGDEQIVTWLPRDIWMGWSKKSPKGTLLFGWCLSSGTCQLWMTIEEGEKAKARFQGFVCGEPGKDQR